MYFLSNFNILFDFPSHLKLSPLTAFNLKEEKKRLAAPTPKIKVFNPTHIILTANEC